MAKIYQTKSMFGQNTHPKHYDIIQPYNSWGVVLFNNFFY